MSLFNPRELKFAQAVAKLNYTNPFGEDRIALERQALGKDYVQEGHSFWAMVSSGDSSRGNVLAITKQASKLVEKARLQILENSSVADAELALYDELVLYRIFYCYFDDWRLLHEGGDARDASKVWTRFKSEFDHWLMLPKAALPSSGDSVHLFSLLYQIYRAFYHIFDCVVGHSKPAANLRSQIWQSIFTHDFYRYRRSLYRNMQEVTTLVTGPSGSGKELVAQAIGQSRFIPFVPKKGCFEVSAASSYFAINISAFSVNLVESELFGYTKGAFTGADAARAGWLETCGKYGTLLLDEIGELDATTQTKLLRVLQNRQYQRMGESKLRNFQGKIIAATNRDLRQEIRDGTFREDLYYRLCADVVTTPALADHLQDDPGTLESLVNFIASRIAPDESDGLSRQVLDWITANLPSNYNWPGNIRELEQCVRNIMVRNSYTPSTLIESQPAGAHAKLFAAIENVSLTADELLTKYAQIAYEKTGNYKQAAELLKIDRRTLRARCQ